MSHVINDQGICNNCGRTQGDIVVNNHECVPALPVCDRPEPPEVPQSAKMGTQFTREQVAALREQIAALRGEVKIDLLTGEVQKKIEDLTLANPKTYAADELKKAMLVAARHLYPNAYAYLLSLQGGIDGNRVKMRRVPISALNAIFEFLSTGCSVSAGIVRELIGSQKVRAVDLDQASGGLMVTVWDVNFAPVNAGEIIPFDK